MQETIGQNNRIWAAGAPYRSHKTTLDNFHVLSESRETPTNTHSFPASLLHMLLRNQLSVRPNAPSFLLFSEFLKIVHILKNW
jgi:hypothetical protein